MVLPVDTVLCPHYTVLMDIDDHYEQLVQAFADAAFFLKDRVRQAGWKWSDNFLREYVRCKFRLRFTNSLSPDILREVQRRYPELEDMIVLGPLKCPASE